MSSPSLHEALKTRRNERNEKTYEMYKSLSQKLKLQSKKLYFQNKLKQYENNIKNVWKNMKFIISRSKLYNDDEKELQRRKPVLENPIVVI